MTHFQYLRETMPRDFFEDRELHFIFKGMSPTAQYSLLSRLLQSQSILKMKRGFYLFNDKYRKQPLSRFVIAAELYYPSYISFESALSHYQLIPEAVYTTTSACFQMKNKSYSTPLGDFVYHHIPSTAFRLDIESIVSNSGSFLMARPMKALFDLVYFNRKQYTNINALESDLRIDATQLNEILKQYSYSDLEYLAFSYKKRNCEQLFSSLMREFK